MTRRASALAGGAANGGSAAIEQRVAEAVAAADRTGAARFVSAVVALESIDPLAFYDGAAGDDRFYWCQPASDVAFASRGAVAVVESKGEGRFEEARLGIASLGALLHVADPGATARRPRFVGGFAFDHAPGAGRTWQAFPPARWVLPEALVGRDAGGAFGVVSQRVVPGDSVDRARDTLGAEADALVGRARDVWHRAPEIDPDPVLPSSDGAGGAEYAVVADRPHDVYRGQVAAALRAIGSGALEKVVLARSLDVRHAGRFDVEAFLETLARIYPHCTVLAIGTGDDTLVAATPELLLRRRDDVVEACAVAGSAPRGRTPAEDDALGRALAESPKEQAEHQAVVRAIRDALADPCAALSEPGPPELMRVEGIQHLATPIVGRLHADASDHGVLELAERLHPTPAVGGLPHAAAHDWIAAHEGLDRGWYAGPVGWVDDGGRGELWVALRSALIRNAPEGAPVDVSTARLFAGAGIVAGSVPDDELRETRLKLRALLAPLTEI